MGFLVDASEEMVEEAARHNARVEALLAAIPASYEVDVATTRRNRLEGRGWQGPIVRSERPVIRTIAGAGGPIELRTVVPEQVEGVFLHLHGGGFVFGGADQQDLLLTTIADALSLAVVSVEYRLAPEHPFPAGPDDCEAAALFVVEHAAEEYGTSRLLIGGESAGAYLAALTLLRLRDRHGITGAFAGANLVFGIYDLSLTPSTRRFGVRKLVLDTPTTHWYADQFVPGTTEEERRTPERSPLYADLSGMPPALFTVGTLDPLLDDSLFMAARWQAAGAEATLRVYPESIHGFISFPTAMAASALGSMLDFGRAILA